MYMGVDLLEIDAADVNAYGRYLALNHFWSEKVLLERYIANGKRSLSASGVRKPFSSEEDLKKIRILKSINLYLIYSICLYFIFIFRM